MVIVSGTLQDWMEQDPRLTRAEKILYIGPDCEIPDSCVKKLHPADTRGFACDAIFISCRRDVCYKMLMEVLFPVHMTAHALLFWCRFDHATGEEPCWFTEIVPGEPVGLATTFALMHDTIQHDPLTETCIPETSVMISRINSGTDATD
jgi:hypothetical protein